MPRIKKLVSKSSRGESSSSMEPPPEGHPMAKWFQHKIDFDHYTFDFEPRKIISPRYLEPNFFEKHPFPNLQACLVAQNLLNHIQIREPFYPDLIAIACTTLELEFNDDDMSMTFKLGKDTHTLDSRELISLWKLWKLDYSGDKIDLSDSRAKHPRKYSRQDACALLNIPFDMPKPTVGCLSHEDRLLHYIIVHNLVPRSHNLGLIMEEDLEIMWNMRSNFKINWVFIIATHIRRIKSGKISKGLPYAILWTTIFKYLNVDLSQAKKKKLGYNNCIDTHVLNHMRIEHNQPHMEEYQAMEEDQAMEEEQAQEAPPQPPQAQDQEPSMRDIMAILQRMEVSQQNLTQQVQNIQSEQRRIWRSVRRMEAYTFDEDWDIPSEDEDQD
ncbi:hypothetical protein PIB30_098768 [Stylosanthes scabra]|uniref:Uncharacterized protein n=1 Tax=Stylosanthes scabra TaxID=79078 RepID=A0ABU6TXJ1_9FABA|nr:hypothetical protein [Stylosanthes scabra]